MTLPAGRGRPDARRLRKPGVRFRLDGAGTRVTWSVQFRLVVPGTGWALRGLLQREFRDVLARLAVKLAPAAKVRPEAADQ